MRQNHLRIVLIGVLAAIPASIAAQDAASVVRRIATTARLAADEYRLGIKDGQVSLPSEVEEAKLFLREAQRAASRLPSPVDSSTVQRLATVIDLLARTTPPDSVTASVEALVHGLSDRLGVSLDDLPSMTPSLIRGQDVYSHLCSSCHGATGGGDGPQATSLTPRPTNLVDRSVVGGSSPLDFYRRITIGVAGTSMPSFEAALTADDRWAVALYASTLRLPSPEGRAPTRLTDFAITAPMSDSAVAAALGSDDLRLVAAVRGAGRIRSARATFTAVRRLLDSSFAQARAGQVQNARDAALDAYLAFEGVERDLRVKDPKLVSDLEAGFARARGGATSKAEVFAIEATIGRGLDRAERLVGTELSPLSLFAQSFVILLREGLEAILVVGALLTFLTRVGARERRRDIGLGVGVAIGLSLITAVLLETVFRLSPSHQEALEAVTMVVATGMLFYVSYWLLSKMEVARWNQFVKTKMSEAMSRRSRWALASVAFLAVYREGFETVLFYKALALTGGSGANTAALGGVAGPIALGVALAAMTLGAIYLALNRFGVRLPLRPFFAVTSGFLYFMAFSFAGTAIAELQEGGFAPFTPVHWLPRVPAIGIYPTLETALVQLVLILLAAIGLIWTFVVAPRRQAALAA